jgi:hypothetical protein
MHDAAMNGNDRRTRCTIDVAGALEHDVVGRQMLRLGSSPDSDISGRGLSAILLANALCR